MAKRPFVSSNPISFSDKDGKHHLIPLSALPFDSEGKLLEKKEDWPLLGDQQALLGPYLEQLLKSGAIWQGSEPAVKPALKVTAVTPGTTGVLIELEFSEVEVNETAPGDSKVSVTVTETNTYTGLSLDKLIETLGDGTKKGTHPGLVFVGTADPALPKAGAYKFIDGEPNSAAKANIPKGADSNETAFTLQARSQGEDGDNITVEVKDNNAQTFALVVAWTKKAEKKPVNLIADEFAFVVEIKPPDGGYRAPAEGKVVLKGGADAFSAPARKASAIVLSS